MKTENKKMRTAQDLLFTISEIGITPNIRKKINHKRIRFAGDQVVIPSHAIEVMKFNRPSMNTVGEVKYPSHRVMVWIENDKVCYAEYDPSIKHYHNGQLIQNYIIATTT